MIVVGAGPGGSIAAKICAEEGLRVVMIEKHPEPGHKLCGGGLTSKVLGEFEIDRNVIESYTRKSTIFWENKSLTVKLEQEEATVYRSKFDRYLADRAVDNGAKIYLSTQSTGVIREEGRVVGILASSKSGVAKIKGKIVIVADGFNSLTARSAGLFPRYRPSDVALTVQKEARTERNVHDDLVYVFVGKNISPCGYGWIYPKSHGYTIGVGCLVSHLKGKLEDRLNYLMHKYPIAKTLLKNAQISRTEAACIPMTPSSRICGNGILVVGDAAGQVDSIGGSGIYFAMKAGELAALTAIKAVSTGDSTYQTLVAYQNAWEKGHGHWLRRRRGILEKNQDRLDKYMYRNIRLQTLLNSNVLSKGIYTRGQRLFRSLFA